MPAKTSDDVSIGKFDILATYTYAKALLDGVPDAEAKERGIVAAVMGAKARSGHAGATHNDRQSDKAAAERKKKTAITADSFDRQVADKMGDFFEGTFLPGIKAFAASGLGYDGVKRRLKIPALWGAKISGTQFKDRAGD